MTLEDLRKYEISLIKDSFEMGHMTKKEEFDQIAAIMSRPETMEEKNILLLNHSMEVFETVVHTLETNKPKGYEDWLAYTDAKRMIKLINDQLEGYK